MPWIRRYTGPLKNCCVREAEALNIVLQHRQRLWRRRPVQYQVRRLRPVGFSLGEALQAYNHKMCQPLTGVSADRDQSRYRLPGNSSQAVRTEPEKTEGPHGKYHLLPLQGHHESVS